MDCFLSDFILDLKASFNFQQALRVFSKNDKNEIMISCDPVNYDKNGTAIIFQQKNMYFRDIRENQNPTLQPKIPQFPAELHPNHSLVFSLKVGNACLAPY